jgi:hypothetical protein
MHNMPPLEINPVHRLILAADVEDSTERTNQGRARMRDDLYLALDEALLAAQAPPACLDRLIDRGDGFLALLHRVDEVPMTVVIRRLIPALAEHICRLPPEDGFRLRVALHEGGVHYDPKGCFSEDVDVVCRLLDSAAVKRKLRQVDSPLVLAITDSIYVAAVRHGYEGIDVATFEQLPNVRMGAREFPAWIHVPPTATVDDEQPGDLGQDPA